MYLLEIKTKLILQPDSKKTKPMPSTIIGNKIVEYDASYPTKTIALIDELVEKYKNPVEYPQFRAIAEKILKDSNIRHIQQEYDRALQIFYNYFHPQINGNFYYFWDPYGIEYVQTPDLMVKTGVGDCDEFTTLIRTIFESIGIRSRARMGAFKQHKFWDRIKQIYTKKPLYSHVWAEVWHERLLCPDCQGNGCRFCNNTGYFAGWYAMDVTIPIIQSNGKIITGKPGQHVVFDYYYS